MSLKAGNFSSRARTAQNWLRISPHMAHIWNSTDLRKPLSTAEPSIHPLSLVQELILGRLHVASS